MAAALGLVLDGHVADRTIVSARTSGGVGDHRGVTLFLIDPREHGVCVNRQVLVDCSRAASVRIIDVAVDDAAVVGDIDHGAELLEAILGRATAGLCAQMVGAMSAAFEMSREYLRTRKQFGVAIGRFQVLKHPAAIICPEIELARSAVMGMNVAIDGGRSGASALVSVAKAGCSEAFLLAANEGVQVHGGIGMTDERDIGLLLKRARSVEMTFGDASWRRDRFASHRETRARQWPPGSQSIAARARSRAGAAKAAQGAGFFRMRRFSSCKALTGMGGQWYRCDV